MACRLLEHHAANLKFGFNALPGLAERPQNMTLDSIPRKANARVVAVDASGSGGLRLMEMGIVPGTPVTVVNSAPLGDPIRIFVKGYHLALRREEARSVHVTLCDDE